jgi:calcineurin-like phosphoesterase family protein
MPSVFLVSDTHFGHAGVCRFTRNDGVTKLRPWTDPDEMDEEMVRRWNERVKPTDKVYHLRKSRSLWCKHSRTLACQSS